MKFAAVAALATVASGASLQKKQSSDTPIANFVASCIPHSTMCSYNFEAVNDPALGWTSHCDALVQGPDYLPSVEEGKCKDNVAYTWSVDKLEDGGLDFKIWYGFNSRSNITFCHNIPADQITLEDNGSVKDQRYVGPANFTASVSNC